MKKIELKKPETHASKEFALRQNVYTVYFNKIEYKFKNKKQAMAFVAELNKFLNNNLHELNFKLIEIYKMYRLAWFYFIDAKTGLNQARKDKDIQQNITEAENQLHRLINNTSGLNGHVFIITFLNGACGSLINAANLLLAVYTRRNEAVNIYICKNLINSLTELQTKIKLFKPTNNLQDQ